MSFIYDQKKEYRTLLVKYQKEVPMEMLTAFLKYITHKIPALTCLEEDAIFGPEALAKVFALLVRSDIGYKDKKEELHNVLKKLDMQPDSKNKTIDVFEKLNLLLTCDQSQYGKIFPELPSKNHLTPIQAILHAHLEEIVKKPWLRESLCIQVIEQNKKVIQNARKQAREEGLSGPAWHPVFAPPKKRARLAISNSAKSLSNQEESEASITTTRPRL